MIFAAIVLAAAGALLLALALRGRRMDDHPICRRCRFDLVGIYRSTCGAGCGAGFQPANPDPATQTPRCPECGADIIGPRSVRIGHRRVRTRMAVVAALMLTAGLLPATVLTWASATNTDWNTWKPEWWLAGEVRRGGSGSEGALFELERRLREDELSRDSSLAVAQLALQHQQDESLAWSPGWASYLENARRLGLLTDDQVRRYLQSVSTATIGMRPRMAQALPWTMRLETSAGRIAAQNDLMLQVTTLGLWVDGRQLEEREQVRSQVYLDPSSINRSTFTFPSLNVRSIGPGEYEVRVPVRFTIIESGGETGQLAMWEEEFAGVVRVVPPGDPVIELVNDEQLRASVEASVEIRSTLLTSSAERGEGFVALRSPPIDVVFDIYWRFDDPFDPEGYQEVRMGYIAARAGENGASEYSRRLNAHIPPSHIELILRPSHRASASQTAFDRIWGEEIIFPVQLTPEEDNG